ncbi:hypothetical protein CHCC20375_1413 [Bacillus licheniformis]|nr:hypothetical protein CHCC20375_1413 [Bacillus licheniformis]
MEANGRPILLVPPAKKEGKSFPSSSVLSNPRIRCQACASVLTNSNIRSAPMLGLPRLQGFSITLN